jgi:hypothetical protein
MTLRRMLIVLVVIGGLVAVVLAGRQSQAVTSPRFATVGQVTRPYASHRTPITTTWYCPGVPAGDQTVDGQLVISNPVDVAVEGRLTLLGGAGVAPVVSDITVPPRDNLVMGVRALLSSDYVSAVVELDGGEGIVEQRALHPAGDAVVPCITQPSSSWYFADGWTVDGSVEQLVITNPGAAVASIDVAFFTKNGVRREPPAFQGDAIQPQSVKVINVAESGLVDEEIIGVQVIAQSGQLLVERAQHYVGGNRLGYSLTLGAPAPSDLVWFAEGEKGDGISEQYVMFNPTDEQVSITPTVLGVPVANDFVQPEPVEVPAGAVVSFDMAGVEDLPDGHHAMAFATLAGASIVIERVQTRAAGDSVATSVVMGMTSEYVVGRWYAPIGVDAATDGALVVFNVDNEDATIAVKAIGTGGEVAVPGLEAVTLPARGVATIDLTDPSVFGRPIVVEATQRVFVERVLPRGENLSGTSSSWALPECGPCNFSSPRP